MASLDYLSPAEDAEKAFQQKIAFTENKVMTIGRHKDNSIVLPAPTVSSFHAEVEKVGQRYRVRDLRSSNGTFVNGQSVKKHFLQNGDTIELGKYRLKYVSEVPQQTAAADFERTMILRPGAVQKPAAEPPATVAASAVAPPATPVVAAAAAHTSTSPGMAPQPQAAAPAAAVMATSTWRSGRFRSRRA